MTLHLTLLDQSFILPNVVPTLSRVSRETITGSLLRNATYNLTTTHPNTVRATELCQAEVKLSVENIAYACFMMFLLLSSLVGNTLVIVATCLSRKLRNRVTVYFIVSLAIADFLTAASSTPFYTSLQLHKFRFCHNLSACYWWLLGESSSTVASILNLFFIAIDRFIAIRFPFKHRTLFSASRVKKMVAGIWLFAILYPISGIFPWSAEYSLRSSKFTVSEKNYVCANYNRPFYVVSFLGIYVVPLFIMTITYCMILHIAISQIRAIESTQVEFRPRDIVSVPSLHESRGGGGGTADANNNNDRSSDCNGRRKQKKKRMKRKELHATKSVAIVYFTFLVCWLPVCVVNIILLYDVNYFPQLHRSNKTLFLFVWYGIIQILPMFNTMVNPLIYSFSNKQFRNGFKSVWTKMIGRYDAQDYSTSHRTTHGLSLGDVNSPPSSNSLMSPNTNESERFATTRGSSQSVDYRNNCGYQTNSIIENVILTSNEILWKPD